MGMESPISLCTAAGAVVSARITDVLQGVGDGTSIVTGHNYQLQGESYPVVGADFNGDGVPTDGAYGSDVLVQHDSGCRCTGA